MEMEEVTYKGKRWTWANNRLGEDFMEERLDIFFGSAEWNIENEKAKVQHFMKHSSNHTMLRLDTHPDQSPRNTRFIYENRWIKRPGCPDVVQSS